MSNQSSHFAPNANHPVMLAGRTAAGVPSQAPARVLRYVWSLRKPATVGEFGCGQAKWLRYARKLGATVHGYDIPEIDLEARHLSADEFTAADLSQPIELDRKFDLAISTEVAEHLPLEAAATFVRTLTGASDWVMFGAAPPFQGGMGHINENWLEFWANLFEAQGYVCYDILRLKFWHDVAVPHYYRQNTVLFVRRGTGQALTKAGLRHTRKPATLIHPEQYLRSLATEEIATPVAVASIKDFYRASGYAFAEEPPPPPPGPRSVVARARSIWGGTKRRVKNLGRRLAGSPPVSG